MVALVSLIFISGLTRETFPYWRATTEAWAEYPPSEESTPVATSMAFTSSANDAGQAQDHLGVRALLLGELVRIQQPFRVEINSSDGGARRPRDSAREDGKPLHGAEIDDGVQDLVELPRLDILHDVRVIHDLPRVKVQEQPNVRLRGLCHHGPLVDQPQALVFNGEPDGAGLLESGLPLSGRSSPSRHGSSWPPSRCPLRWRRWR